MPSHWQKRGPKSAKTYRAQREAQRLAEEKGHKLGRFKRMSHEFYIAFCVKCPASMAVMGGRIVNGEIEKLEQATHDKPAPWE
jgi:hypothetical protein